MHLVRMDLIRGNTVFDDEILSDFFSHRIEDLTGKARTVFQASSVFVCTFVEIRAGKLGDQIAVSAVYVHHFHARLLGKAGRPGIFTDGFADVFGRHFFRRNRFSAKLFRAVSFRSGNKGRTGKSRPPDLLRRGVLAVMGQFQNALHAVAGAHFRKQLQFLNTVRMIQTELPGFIAAFRDINGAVAHLADGHAALRVLAEILYKKICNETPFIPCEKAARRRLLKAVLKPYAADFERIIYMRIPAFHLLLPCFSDMLLLSVFTGLQAPHPPRTSAGSEPGRF